MGELASGRLGHTGVQGSDAKEWRGSGKGVDREWKGSDPFPAVYARLYVGHLRL